MMRTRVLTAMAAALAIGMAAPAFADPPWHHDHDWERHEWREHHHHAYYGAPPPVVYSTPRAYYAAPPPVVYGGPGVSLGVTIP